MVWRDFHSWCFRLKNAVKASWGSVLKGKAESRLSAGTQASCSSEDSGLSSLSFSLSESCYVAKAGLELLRLQVFITTPILYSHGMPEPAESGPATHVLTVPCLPLNQPSALSKLALLCAHFMLLAGFQLVFFFNGCPSGEAEVSLLSGQGRTVPCLRLQGPLHAASAGLASYCCCNKEPTICWLYK